MKSKDRKKTKDQPTETSAPEDKGLAKEIADLQNQVERLESEKQNLFEKLQRLSADYANFQKRTPRQIADSVAYEKKAIIRSLLPSLDNLAHALASAENADTAEGLDSVIKGIRLVFDHMLDALKAHGVERIIALGAEFDPSLHQAVMQRAEADKPDNIVLEEYQNGYTLNGQVIRPAKVIVNKLTAAQPKNENADSQEDETSSQE
jgi:molecular chaperone GrpE